MKIEGKKVYDAKAPIFLTITEGDIKRATPHDPSCCAAAQACMRQLHASKARVHMACIYVFTSGKWYRYHTPSSLRSEIIAYDRRSSFCPGVYKLNPLRPSKKLTGKRYGGDGTKRGKKPGPKAKRAIPHFVTGIRTRMAGFKVN